MRDFDNHFRSMQKQSNSLFRFAFGAWLIGALVSLVALAGIVYVACHFLAKVW